MRTTAGTPRRGRGRPERSQIEALLSRREREVAALVAEGLRNAEIARRLVISRRTVESHVDNVKKKLKFASRYQVIAWILSGRAEAKVHSDTEDDLD